MSNSQAINQAVANLYNTYPFPPIPYPISNHLVITGGGVGRQLIVFVQESNPVLKKFGFLMQGVVRDRVQII